AVVTALALAGSAQAKDYSLPSADVDVTVASNGALLVRENITFEFFGSFSGAYRDIPLRKGESIDHVLVSENGRPYSPGGNTKLGSADSPDKYGVEQSSKRVRVVWHYRAQTEMRTFTISYRFNGLAVAYDDVVDVNLKVWGSEWKVGLSGLSAEVGLPMATALDESYRVYGHPQWVHGVVDRRP